MLEMVKLFARKVRAFGVLMPVLVGTKVLSVMAAMVALCGLMPQTAWGDTQIGSSNEYYARFTSDGSWIAPANSSSFRVLLVGGGGGGGGHNGGGGGAGELYYGTPSFSIGHAYTITVGTGGAGGAGSGSGHGSNGGSSSISGSGISLTVKGGGGGGSGVIAAGTSGNRGGSGGGGAGYIDSGTSTQGGGTSQSASGFVHAGGNGYYSKSSSSILRGGGGGGAGGDGKSAGASTFGTGGAGMSYDITGQNVTYAVGGAGSGAPSSTSEANTGSGGDGKGASTAGTKGTDGVVIIRYTIQTHTHSYTGAVTTPATCTTPGVTTYTCQNSGCDRPTYTDSIPATGHSWSAWTQIPDTQQEKRTCSVCFRGETRFISTPMSDPSWGYEIHGLGTTGNEVALVYTNQNNNAMTFTAPSGVSSVQLLLVGGGGSGGAGAGNSGGGGGAGGVRYESAVGVTAGNPIDVKVGKGGSAVTATMSASYNGNNGGDSYFGSSYFVYGGGGGSSPSAANDGGSGGGGGMSNSPGSAKKINNIAYGCDGGAGAPGPHYAGGGGGGASENGASSYDGNGGAGGAGRSYDITGESVTYGGGGGGGGSCSDSYFDKKGGAGGLGGGGAGCDGRYKSGDIDDTYGSGEQGIDGTGGGGGGARYTTSGAGGSGVVIVRYTAIQNVEKPEALGTDTKTYAATNYKPTDVPTSSGYTIEYTKNDATYQGAWKDVGTYKVTLKLKSGIKWTDGTSADFDYYTLTISQLNLSDCTMTVGGQASGYTTSYTGSEIRPTVEVKAADNKTLAENTDYTVSYSDNTNPGQATVTITGKSPNVTGTLASSFTITKANLSTATISVSPAIEQYTGEVVPTPSVTVTLNGATIDVSHYDVSWDPATLQEEGNYNVTVTAKSDDTYYMGSAARNNAFSISTTPTWYASEVKNATTTELGQERVYVWKTESRTGTSGSITLPVNVIADILVVGGGGAGGAARGGGGGAGGMIYKQGVKLTAGTYNITVGAGGLARLPGATGATAAYDGTYFATADQDGKNSSISLASAALYTAFGGGAGQSYVDYNTHTKVDYNSYTANGTNYVNTGRAGGSSGGSAGYAGSEKQGVTNALCVAGQGSVGGTGDRTALAFELMDWNKTTQTSTSGKPVSNNLSGGGGGAGAPGGDANLQLDVMASGNGGVGLLCDITGEALYYAGGGGGGSYQDDANMNYLGLDRKAGLGGEGGGGNGADSKHPTAEDGEPGTGGGGGGGSGYGNNAANCIPGDGGSGIVVIRLKMADEEVETDDETEGEWVWKTNLGAGRWHKKGNWTPEEQGLGYPNGKLSTANFAPATDDVASYIVTAIGDVSVSNLVFRSGAAPTRITLSGNTLTAQNRLAITNASVTFKNGAVNFKTLEWGDQATVTFDAAQVTVDNGSAATAAGTPSAGEIVFQNGTTATWGDFGYAGSAANHAKVTVDGSTVTLGKFATNGDLPDALTVIGSGNLTLAQMTAGHQNALTVDGGSKIAVTSGAMKPVSDGGTVSIGKGMVTGSNLATGVGTIKITVPNEGYTTDFLPFKLTDTTDSSIADWQFQIDYSNWGSLSLLSSGAKTEVTVPLITGNSVLVARTFENAFVNEPIGCQGSLEFSKDHRTLNLVVKKMASTEYWWKATDSTISWSTPAQWMSSANYSTSRNQQPNSYEAIVYAYHDNTSTKGELNVTDGFKSVGIFTTGVRTGVATDEMLVKGNGNASANGIQYNRTSTDGTIWRLNAGTTRVQSFGVKSVGSKAGYIDLQPQAKLIAEGLVADSSTILRFTSKDGWNGSLQLTGTANTFGGFNGTSADAVLDITSDNARTTFTGSGASGDTGKLALKVTLGSNNNANNAVFTLAGALKAAAGSTLAIDATGVSAGDYKIVSAASGSDFAALVNAATVMLPTGSNLQVRWLTTATDLTLRLCYTAVKPVLTVESGYHTGSSQKSVVDPSDDTGKGYTYDWTGNWTDVGTHSVTATLNANTYWVGETGDAATAPITLTYEILASTYTITVAAGHSSATAGSTESYTFSTSQQTVEIKTLPKYTGRHISGWTIMGATGGTVTATETGLITIPANVSGDLTLTPTWEANTYTVKYNANGGEGTMVDTTHTYGTASKLSKNTFTRTGYTFTEWNTKADGTGTSYADEKEVSIMTSGNNATVNLYAQWTANTYTITVAGGEGGTAGSAPDYTTAGESQPVTITLPTKTGYHVASWSVTGYMGDEPTVSGTTLTIPANTFGNLTLTPTWEGDTYMVTYKANGGVGNDVVETRTYGKGWKIPDSSFTRTGYTFQYWNRKADGSHSTHYQKDRAINNALDGYDKGNVDLYAIWAANTYTVQFEGNGATSGSMENQTLTYDAEAALTTLGFTKTNYRFKGWSATGATGKFIYADAKVVSNLTTTAGATVTLHAIWEKIPLAFKFDPNGGKTLTDNARVIPQGDKMTHNANIYPSANMGYFGSLSSTVTLNNETGFFTVNQTKSSYVTYPGFPTKPMDFIFGGLNYRVVLALRNVDYTHFMASRFKIETNAKNGDYDASYESQFTEPNLNITNLNVAAESVASTNCFINVTGRDRDESRYKTQYFMRSLYYSVKPYYPMNFNWRLTCYAGRAPEVDAYNPDNYVAPFEGFVECQLPTPTRSGYTFKGWYTAAEGGTLVDANTVADGDTLGAAGALTTLYAQWDKVIAVLTADALTYNGKEQSVSFGSAPVTIGGTTQAKNADTYTATVTPNAGYCWSDGSTGEQEVEWTIDKAPLTITLPDMSGMAKTAKVAEGADPEAVKGYIAANLGYSGFVNGESETTVSPTDAAVIGLGDYTADFKVDCTSRVSNASDDMCNQITNLTISVTTLPQYENYEVQTIATATMTVAPGTYIWKGDATGEWNDMTKWTCANMFSRGYPDSMGATAYFTNIANVATKTVTVTIPRRENPDADHQIGHDFDVGQIYGAGKEDANTNDCTLVFNGKGTLRANVQLMSMGTICFDNTSGENEFGTPVQYVCPPCGAAKENPYGLYTANMWLGGANEETSIEPRIIFMGLTNNPCESFIAARSGIGNKGSLFSYSYAVFNDCTYTHLVSPTATNSCNHTSAPNVSRMFNCMSTSYNSLYVALTNSVVIEEKLADNKSANVVGQKAVIELSNSTLQLDALDKTNFRGTFILGDSVFQAERGPATVTNLTLKGASSRMRNNDGTINLDGPMAITYPEGSFRDDGNLVAPIKAKDITITDTTIFTINASNLVAGVEGDYPLIMATNTLTIAENENNVLTQANILCDIDGLGLKGELYRTENGEGNEIRLRLTRRFEAANKGTKDLFVPDIFFTDAPTTVSKYSSAQTLLSGTNDNGVVRWHAYVAGFDFTELDTAKMVTKPAINGTITLDSWPTEPPTDSGYSVKYQLIRATDPNREEYTTVSEEDSLLPTFKLPLPERDNPLYFYRIKAIYTKEE